MNKSSSLDDAAVRHVAKLARLTITDEEVARYAGQLSEILGYVEQLNEVDTTDVPPTAHALPISNVFREDSECVPLEPGGALSNAPGREGDFFRAIHQELTKYYLFSLPVPQDELLEVSRLATFGPSLRQFGTDLSCSSPRFRNLRKRRHKVSRAVSKSAP